MADRWTDRRIWRIIKRRLRLANAPKNSTFCSHSLFTCFIWISEQTAVISLYSVNWLDFIAETMSVYCAVRAEYLYIIQVMCFVWIWEQTAIISPYNINWLVFITETESVYCAVRTGSLYITTIWHCNPLWVFALSAKSLQVLLSLAISFQFLTFGFFWIFIYNSD
jgi:hypothetical protein